MLYILINSHYVQEVARNKTECALVWSAKVMHLVLRDARCRCASRGPQCRFLAVLVSTVLQAVNINDVCTPTRHSGRPRAGLCWPGCTHFVFLFSELEPGTSYVRPAAGSGTLQRKVRASQSGGRRLLLIASRRKWQRRQLLRLTRQRARAAAALPASTAGAGMSLSSENTPFQLSPSRDSLMRTQERTC